MAWASAYTPDFRVASLVGAGAGTTAANDRRLLEGMNGTPTFVLDAIDTGRYALRHTATASSNITLADMVATPRYQGVLFRWRAQTVGTANCNIMKFNASVSTEHILLRVLNTDGSCTYSFNNGTNYTAAGFTLPIDGSVANIEAFVDWGTGTTHTFKVRVNGVEVLNVTGGAAAATGGNAAIGVPAAQAGWVVDYADMANYNDPAQYGTIGSDWRVIGLEPTVDGTHSMTANDFQNEAATNLTNASTGTFAKVDDAPSAAPTVTDFVQQVVTRTTSYMEWVLRTMPSGYGNPVLVCLVAAMHPVAAATANTVAFRLNSGGNLSAEAAIDTSIASNTLEYRKHHYVTEPSTAAAWTTAMVQAPLRARFGYSSDAAPPPALDSIMAFVVAPVSAGTTKTGTTETNSTTEVSTQKASYPSTESGSGGTQSSTLKAALPRTETGSGSDVSTLKVVLARTDSASGADSSQHYYKASDSAAGTDASTEHAALPRTDSGTTSDASRSYRSTSDSGTGADVSTVTFKLTNNFDAGQADATTITTGNSGGNGNSAFDNVAGSPKFASIQKNSGTQSMDIPLGALRQVTWSTALGARTHIWTRAYFYLTTVAGVRIMQADGPTTSQLFRISQKSTGVMTINVNGSSVTDGTIAMNQNGWCRVEAEYQIVGGNCILTAKLFNSPNGTTPTETLGPITVASPGDTTINGVRYGVGSTVAADYFMDDLEVNNTGFPGPLATTTPTSSETGTGSDVSTLKVALPQTDTGSGSAVSTLHALLTRTDAGAGADASSEHAVYGRTESGTTSDASTLNTGSTSTPHGTDSASGSDASVLRATYPRTDSGTGSDTTRSYRSRTDSGSGTDTSKGLRLRTESSAGSDVSIAKVVLPRVQTGTGSDSSSLFTGGTVKHGTDSAFGTDLSISTVFAADAGVHLSSIVQGSDGTLWMGNAVGVTDHRYIAKSTNNGNTWTWVTPATAINETIWNTTRTWWLAGAFPDMNGKSYSVSQLKVDPVDPTVIYSCGRAGVWQSRDSGATWRPAMNGQDGSESNAFSIGASGEAWATDTDYTASHTTNFWQQANRQTTSLPTFQTPSISRTVAGNTYVIANSPPPATLKINGGADKFDDFAKSACMNPKDIGIMSDGTILVALSGGVLVGRPSGANYVWSKAGNSGGGYCNAIDVDPRGGAVTLAGDVWGFNASLDGGNNFIPTNYGQGTGSNVPYGRAVCYSQKNPNRCYVGVGTLVFASGTGGGYLGVIDQSAAHAPYQLDQLNSTVSFTTHLPTGMASDLPRPVGNLIAVDYDTTSGIEYLYCLTRQGLKMSTNNGVTLTDLGLPAPPDPSAWAALCVMPNGDLLAATFRTSASNSGTTLYWVRNPRSGSPTIQAIDGVPPVIEDICVTTLGSRQVMMLACGINGLIRINGLFIETPTVPTTLSVSAADSGAGTESRTLKAALPRTQSVTSTDASQVRAGTTNINPVPDTAHGNETSLRIAQPTILRD